MCLSSVDRLVRSGMERICLFMLASYEELQRYM